MMACNAMMRSSCFSEPEGVMQPRIRKDFPETWIWESVEDKRYFKIDDKKYENE